MTDSRQTAEEIKRLWLILLTILFIGLAVKTEGEKEWTHKNLREHNERITRLEYRR